MTEEQKIDALTDLLTDVMHTLDLKQYHIDDPFESHKCEVEADDYYHQMVSILNSEEHISCYQ